jgi:hypothetical protein
MSTLAPLLLVIAVLLLFVVVLGLLGLVSLEVRCIVRVWSRDPNDPLL